MQIRCHKFPKPGVESLIPGNCTEQHIPKWCFSVSWDCCPGWVMGRQEAATGNWSADNCGVIHKLTRWNLGGSLHFQRDARQLQRNDWKGSPYRKGSEKHERLAAGFSRKALIIARSWQKSQWAHETGGSQYCLGGSGMRASPTEAEDQKPHLFPGPKTKYIIDSLFPSWKFPLCYLLTEQPQVNKSHNLSETQEIIANNLIVIEKWLPLYEIIMPNSFWYSTKVNRLSL